MIGGRFAHFDNGVVLLPNTLMNEGAELLMKMIFQNAAIGGGSNFYVGLCSDTITGKGMDLTDIVGEPVGFGYARQVLALNSTDWPDPVTTNDVTKIISKTVAFTAAGGPFNVAISRMFLTNVLTGTAGILFALSAALENPLTVADTTTENFTYEFYWI